MKKFLLYIKVICFLGVCFLVISCSNNSLVKQKESPFKKLFVDFKNNGYIGKEFVVIQEILSGIESTKIVLQRPNNRGYSLKDLKNKYRNITFDTNGYLTGEYKKRYIQQLNDVFFNDEIISYENINEYVVYVYPEGIYNVPPVANSEEIWLFLVKEGVLVSGSVIFPKFPWYSRISAEAGSLYLPKNPRPIFLSGEKIEDNNVFSDSDESFLQRSQW